MLTTTFIYGFALWVHIAAVAVAVGGAFILRYAVYPVMQAESDESRRRIQEGIRRRLFAITMVAITLLILSGIINLIHALTARPAPIPLYHMLFGIKMLCVLALFTIGTLYTVPSDPPNAMQRNPRRTLSLLVHLGITIILISVALSFIRMF